LSASLGCPGDFEDRVLIDAMEKVHKAGIAMKKPGGLHVVEPDPVLLKKYIEQGLRFMAYSVDIRMLDRTCRDTLVMFK